MMKTVSLDRIGSRVVLAGGVATLLCLATLLLWPEFHDQPSVAGVLGSVAGLGIAMAHIVDCERRRLGGAWRPLEVAEIRYLGVAVLMAALAIGIGAVRAIFAGHQAEGMTALYVVALGWVSSALTVVLAPVWHKAKELDRGAQGTIEPR